MNLMEQDILVYSVQYKIIRNFSCSYLVLCMDWKVYSRIGVTQYIVLHKVKKLIFYYLWYQFH